MASGAPDPRKTRMARMAIITTKNLEYSLKIVSLSLPTSTPNISRSTMKTKKAEIMIIKPLDNCIRDVI